MNDVFERRVQGAAVALWWAVLVAIVFLAIQWIAYLVVMNSRPAWVACLWGPNLDWEFVQTVWFWMAAIFKLYIWGLALAALWLTFWARQLRKTATGS